MRVCVRGSLSFETGSKNAVIPMSVSPGRMLSGLFVVGAQERRGLRLGLRNEKGGGTPRGCLAQFQPGAHSLMEGQEMRSGACGHLLGVIFPHWSFSSEGSVSNLIC